MTIANLKAYDTKKRRRPKKVTGVKHSNTSPRPFDYISFSGGASGGLRRVSTGNTSLNFESILQGARSETEVIRILNRHSAVFSTAVFNLVEIALEDINIKCLDASGRFSPGLTAISNKVYTGLNEQKGLKGFNSKRGISGYTASMLQEVILTGGVMVEALVNKTEISNLFLVPIETISFDETNKGDLIPNQAGASLDYPNIFYESLHQQAASHKASSMLVSAVPTTIAFSNFIKSMEKVLDRTGHSRLVVTLDKETYIEAAPEECEDDPVKMAEWLELNRDSIAELLKKIDPEDALVMFSDQKADILEGTNVKADYSELLKTMAGLLAISLKSHPSIIGLRVGGSQSLSNMEALTYLHLAKGIQRPVAEVWGRILTLSLRLLGLEGKVEVTFDPIDLRPDTELETHKLTKQTRLLQQLSLGIISDEEFFFQMKLGSPPKNYTKLSGTGFMKISGDIKSTGGISNSQDGGAGHTLNPSSPKNKS